MWCNSLFKVTNKEERIEKIKSILISGEISPRGNKIRPYQYFAGVFRAV